jgi:CDP-glucose 4,6-dehydratase
LIISSYRRSFFPFPGPVKLASARAGNVIGGGDWAADRIIPDCIRSLRKRESIPVRNKVATRPWQHVLEPLSGYLWLGAVLANEESSLSSLRRELCSGFNFGPSLQSNRTVAELVLELVKHSGGEWTDASDPDAPHEASKLNLATDKAFHLLEWQPVWDFEKTLQQTASWYLADEKEGFDASAHTLGQIENYQTDARDKGITWARS